MSLTLPVQNALETKFIVQLRGGEATAERLLRRGKVNLAESNVGLILDLVALILESVC